MLVLNTQADWNCAAQKKPLDPLVIIIMWMVWVLGAFHDESTDFSVKRLKQA
jgi:hypothetical protein